MGKIVQYIVVLHEGKWKISYEGKHYGPYPTQEAASAAAATAAKKLNADSGQNTQVLIQGRDNKFRIEWTYGIDSYPPRG